MNLLKTPEDISLAVSSFKNLLNSAGWKLFEEITKANIEQVKNIILKGGLPEEELNGYRKKLEAYEEDLNCPQTMIDKLTSSETETPEADPYETVEQSKERKKASA